MKSISGKKLLFICSFIVLFSPFAQSNSFEIDESEIDDFVDYLLCDFDLQISEADLEAALNGLIELDSVGCDPVEPQLLSITSNSAYFEWAPSGNATDYTVAAIGLQTGLVFQDVTNTPKYSFTGLTPQEYLFVFIANCLNGPSVASIVIADLDVYSPEIDFAAMSDCSCPMRSEQPIYPNAACPFYPNATTFAWNNGNCDARKYEFTVSGYGGYNDEKEVWIFNNTVSGEITLSAFDCSDLIVPIGDSGAFEVEDPNNFEVVLSTDGAHFYMENTSLSISALKCGCYNGLQTTSGQGRLQLLTNTPFEVSPNPFQDRLDVTTNMTSEGTAKISIIGLDGKVIRSEKRPMLAGFQSTSIYTNDLLKGVYTMLFEINDQRYVEKLVKI